MTQPRPPHADPAYREARRAAARAHHPDAGGDAESLIRALRDIDAKFSRGTVATQVVVGVSRRRLAVRRLSRVRRLLPARRTYVDLPTSSADRPPRPTDPRSPSREN
ncbi:hypothetical protein [Rhodococcus sp. SORGH_AS_0301]|uniref:hypothetical protein n=1 Tax=Rhodococcus sp. SORGH_AS_0301 TaxID=3041780 RepID=UPI0027879EDE|nr:hypothetical protein [Rhodococcus sp. SORGH_AS_0301]MDQ1178707.1 hypothetical protein [Rhodococcus sp. SORGH_AS_0301]